MMKIPKPIIFASTHFNFLLKISLLLVIIALITSAWAAFNYGQTQAGLRITQMLAAQALLRQENTKLEQALANQKQNTRIDDSQYQSLKAQLTNQQATISDLDEELGFFRKLASPDYKTSSLDIERFNLFSTQKKSSFDYKFVLTQMLKNTQTSKGSISIKIKGTINRKPKTLTLDKIKFEFKYFSRKQGHIKLPKAFSPTIVDITIVTTSKPKKTIHKQFNWSPQKST